MNFTFLSTMRRIFASGCRAVLVFILSQVDPAGVALLCQGQPFLFTSKLFGSSRERTKMRFVFLFLPRSISRAAARHRSSFELLAQHIS